MLFSSEPIAEFINTAFEPAWESLGPVPTVTVDFGNGRTVTRTLNGNVATYVCTADGRVLDILPGLYAPVEYRRALEQLFLIHQYATERGPGAQAIRLKDYHQRQFAQLSRGLAPGTLQIVPGAGASILGQEAAIRLVVSGKPPAPPRVDPAGAVGGGRAMGGAPGWRDLADDTRYNLSVRRKLVHEKLAVVGPVPPKEIVKWLYKEVLATDLDDPTLGIGELLNRRYPFDAPERNPDR